MLFQILEGLCPLIFQRSKAVAVPVCAAGFGLSPPSALLVYYMIHSDGVGLLKVTHPGGGVNGGALFDQHVGDSHVTFLSYEVQRGQSILTGGGAERRSQFKGQNQTGSAVTGTSV